MDRRRLVGSFAFGIGLAALAGPAAAAGSTEAGSAAASRALAEGFAAALSAHDLAAFAALYAEDYAQHQTLAGPAPHSGASAKAAAVAYFAARLKALPDLAVSAGPILATADMVAANFVYTGTQTGAYFGVPASGRRVTFNSTDILRVRGGRFTEHWGAVDLHGLLAQMRG